LLLQIENSIIAKNSSTKAYPHHYIAIEEPEIHLHPKYQSLLADLFVEAYQNYNIHFIIETHSEYLIRKLQTMIAKKEVSNSDVSIIYVYDKENRPDNEPQVKRIDVSNKGMLLGRFGEGFFDEADELSLYLLMQQRKHD
jgi:predicted ATPase